jgi:hypothetical protein
MRGDRFSLSPFFMPGSPCICGLPRFSLWTRRVTFHRFLPLENEFLSFFSVALWTRPQAEPSIHAGSRDWVGSCHWIGNVDHMQIQIENACDRLSSENYQREFKIKRLTAKRQWYLDRWSRWGMRRARVRNQSASRRKMNSVNRPVFAESGVWRAPKEFNLTDVSHRSTLLTRLGRLRQLLRKGDPVCIDFSETERMVADGTLLFLAELRRLIKHAKGELVITCTPPKNDKVAQVLQQIGLFSLLGVTNDTVPKDDDVVNWRFAHGHKVEGERYEDVLAEYDGDIASQLQETLFTGITEAMTNVLNHAYLIPREDGTDITNSREWWMFSQAKDGEITVAFLDLGAGIPRTLPMTKPGLWRKFLQFGKSQDSRAIQYAVKDSISRTNESHRGKGLGQIARVIDQVAKGEMAILSNYGALSRSNEVMRRKDYSDSIRGTLIFWKIPLPVKEAA